MANGLWDFEARRQPDAGNLLFSYGVGEDHMAGEVHGYEFLGVGRDDRGNEVHVFRMVASVAVSPRK